jgi:hypothetical protein
MKSQLLRTCDTVNPRERVMRLKEIGQAWQWEQTKAEMKMKAPACLYRGSHRGWVRGVGELS